MADKKNVAALEAKFGEKMIEIKIRFWTNDLTSEAGKIRPKHGWSSGVVRMAPNKSHGIVPQYPKVFNSLLDVGAVIERVLIDHEIVLHKSNRMKKYVD